MAVAKITSIQLPTEMTAHQLLTTILLCVSLHSKVNLTVNVRLQKHHIQIRPTETGVHKILTTETEAVTLKQFRHKKLK
jgi:hypothetical protein